MKFGKVDNPEKIDFTLPPDHSQTKEVFEKTQREKTLPNIYVGCAKWNKTDLKNFYPKGTKDELSYYSMQFNCIELNATFYRLFPPEQFEKWKDKVPEGFKFFPKITQEISHYKQLKEVKNAVDQYLLSATKLEEKLGTIFLQLNARFSPKHIEKLRIFVEDWPKDVSLAIEVRHEEWFTKNGVIPELSKLLKENGVANILVDTAGRRDMMHMQMTNATPFVRYVGANYKSDYSRIDDWVDRIKVWIDQGMEELYFFVHQNLEKESPLIAVYLIEKLNKELGYNIHVPQTLKRPEDSEYLLL